jgi:hypothetical protein
MCIRDSISKEGMTKETPQMAAAAAAREMPGRWEP